jgi:ketosteroid isomerase-like protein
VREWIELISETFAGVHTEIGQIADLGDDCVFIAVILTARGRGSGVPIEYRTWQIVWFADGLITRRQVFWTRDEALEAAGLSE